MPGNLTAELLIDAHCKLAEGPVWHEKALWWTDIDGRTLHCWRGEGERESWPMPVRVGAMVPTDQGRWVLACDDGFHFWRPGGEREAIANPQANDGTRFNDGKVGPQGRLFAGTMVLNGPRGSGSFYRLDPGGKVTLLFTAVQCSNGLAWSEDGRTLWYIDTPSGRVDTFDFEPLSGDLSNRRPAVTGFPGHPDGMCIDAEEKLWVAQWGGSCVVRCDPRSGKHLSRVALPVPNVTSCCFGGPDLRTLYITTAGGGKDDSPEHAGGIFVVPDAGVKGTPVMLYREQA